MDLLKIGATIAKESMPLVQKMISAYVEGKQMEKHSELFEKKMIRSMEILDQHDTDKNKTSTKPGLTKGILKGEGKDELGRRKWKEYENHLAQLPDSATPVQAQKALKEIQDNISKEFPCEECRIHAIDHLSKFPLTDKSVTGKDDAKARLCTFHNIVNDQLGKPITVKCSPIEE